MLFAELPILRKVGCIKFDREYRLRIRKGGRMTDPECSNAQRTMILAFGRELPKLRKAIKVSQTFLGKKIGVSRQYVSSIERGEAQLSWATYIAAVNFFSVNDKPVIRSLINEHKSFVAQYMKNPNGEVK